MKPLFALMFAALSSGVLTASAAPAANSRPIFYIIPHTHWEGAVFKTREEYLDMGLPNILTAVRLLKENPNYRFALDQVAYFKPFLERYPEEATAFRRFVREGRLQIVGGMNVMPDDNMPDGEHFVRQFLYAKGYCREALGIDVRVGWLLDTFGHHAQMPQILTLAGLDSFWFFRGVEDRAMMPSEFLWEGLDGSRIPAHWLPFAYGNVYGPPADLPRFTESMKKAYDALAPFSRGAGDRVGFDGADVTEPELFVPGLVERFNQQSGTPFRLQLAVPTDYQRAVAKLSNLPVIRGERNPLFQGVYSTRIELKQAMREAERLLTTEEEFDVIAALLGKQPDQSTLWRAWEPVLFNVTHDLTSGVMTDHVYEDTRRGYDFSARLANEQIDASLAAISGRIDTRGEGIPVVVVNTLGSIRTDVAEVDLGFAEGGIKSFSVKDADGGSVPAQLIQIDRYADGGLKRVKCAFLARDIPPVGYAIYRVVSQKTAGTADAAEATVEPGNMLENEFYRATFDLRTGALTGLRVKDGDWEAMSAPGNVVAQEPDQGDVWELYKTLDGGQNLMMTRPMPVPQRGQARFSDESAGAPGVVRRGPVFSEFQVRHPFGTNTFATRVRLYQGISRVDFETSILNQEQYVRYRLLMPTTIQNGRNMQEIPFGAVERPLAQEFPAQNWIDLSNDQRGCALLNRGLPGNNIADGTLMLSLLRSTRIQDYGGFAPSEIRSDTALELGRELTLRYALAPHQGDWRTAGTVEGALEFTHPLVVRKLAVHNGTLPNRWSLLAITPSNVVLSAVKLAKDGATVVRVYESAGKTTPGASIKLHARLLGARQANLMEDSGRRLEVRNNSIEFDLHPFEIRTFKLQVQPQGS